MGCLFNIGILLLAWGFLTLIEKHNAGALFLGLGVLSIIGVILLLVSFTSHAWIAYIFITAVAIELIGPQLAKKWPTISRLHLY